MELRATSPKAVHESGGVIGADSDKSASRRGPLTSGTPPAVLTGLIRQQERADGVPRGATQLYSVRGVPAASPGDGSEFGKALEAAADKKVDALLEGVDKGLSPAEASAHADELLGKTDPQSNFEAHYPVALRGVEESHSGDGSIFDKVVDEVAGNFASEYHKSMAEGATPKQAQAAGDKAVGRIDPQANFSMRRPILSRLAAALRPSRPQGEIGSETKGHPQSVFSPRMA